MKVAASRFSLAFLSPELYDDNDLGGFRVIFRLEPQKSKNIFR